MKKDQVKVGGVYAAKVSDKVVPVRIDREHPNGGWVGTNQETGKEVRVKSAQRLRGPWVTKAKAKAMVAAEQENARLAQERAASPDGMTASERAMTKSAQDMAKKTVSAGDLALLDKDEVKVIEVDQAGDDPCATAMRMADGQTIKAVPLEDLTPLAGSGAPGHAQGEEKGKGKPKAKEPKKRAPRANTGGEGGQMSGLDAAAKVLEEASEPLSCKAIVERAFAKGYWRSDGKTPSATIYSAILREVTKKGEESRFRKVERGKFTLAR